MLHDPPLSLRCYSVQSLKKGNEPLGLSDK